MNQETSLNVDVLLEFRDYLRANLWFLFKSLKWLVLIAMLSPFIALYSWTQNPGTIPWPALILPAILLFAVLATYLGAKRSMASNKSLQENIHYTFSENGIDAVAVSSSGHTSWANVYRAVETTHNFLIFISRNQMFVIPKRYFHDEQKMRILRNLLQHHLPGKTKLKS
jgi:hypothetical protein